MKKRTPIKKKSEKRKNDEKVYKELRKNFLNENPYCKAQLPGCTGMATECHHSKGRVGKNYLDVNTFVALCHACHVFVELNPVIAKELGLSQSRLS
jgi:hypothetical protein